MSIRGRKKEPLDPEKTWGTIQATLDRLFTFPEDITLIENPVPLAPADWMAANTAVYTWCSSIPQAKSSYPIPQHLHELCLRLEEYFGRVCKDLNVRLIASSKDDFINTYNVSYRGFRQRVATAGRICARLNRPCASRARQEGNGWMFCPFPDVSGQIPPGRRWTDERGNKFQEAVPVPKHLEEDIRKRQEWINHSQELEKTTLVDKWGLSPDASKDSEEWKQATIRAEAGSDPDQVHYIGVQALGLRRWRVDVLEPLLGEQFVPLISGGTLSDTSALRKLFDSMKDVGIKVDDERRQKVEKLAFPADA
jgi:hypothetical protein